jgi:hypothetical protein
MRAQEKNYQDERRKEDLEHLEMLKRLSKVYNTDDLLGCIRDFATSEAAKLRERMAERDRFNAGKDR